MLEASFVKASEVDDQSTFFLLNSKISSLDIAIFPFIRQFAFVDKVAFDDLELPKLQRWLEYFLNSALFLSVMEKHPLYTDNWNTIITQNWYGLNFGFNLEKGLN